ncbi:MAG: response regulator transcription factor [Peptostreptococcus sp.]|nr:response regulator transcription factor [Peptostreptococcus sp.]
MLSEWGFEVVLVEDFMEVLSLFVQSEPHLVLMDIGLPLFNGYHWCQEIRKISKVPIIFISSKSENMDIVMAMQFGGDDYITKPLNMDVTVAKVQAMLRRAYKFVNDIYYISYGSVNLHITDAKITYDGQEVSLTKTELLIAQSLFKAQGGVASRESLMDRCWQNDNFIDDNTLAVNINRLRKKLSQIGLEGLIETKKGIGYYLREGV